MIIYNALVDPHDAKAIGKYVSISVFQPIIGWEWQPEKRQEKVDGTMLI